MRTLAPLLTVLLALLSCSDDNSPAPSVTFDFVEAVTGSDGCVFRIVTDRNETYSTDRLIEAGVKDTTYRCIASYSVSSDAAATSNSNIAATSNGNPTATVYNIEHIYSALPAPPEKFTSQPTDPVKLQSWWQGGKYVNAIVGILTTGQGNHGFAFCEDSPTQNADGTVTANVRLLHQRPLIDPESYTETVYLSIPIEKYRTDCDSVAFTLNTYEGEKRKAFKI